MSTVESKARSQFPRLFAELAAKFARSEEKVLPKGEGVLYVTARTIMNRFDAVLGNENWWDEYIPLMGDSVLCKLTIRLPDGSTLTKQDAGGAAGMKDAGDDDKSMVSDAFKRAAVKFGAGRYLYRDGVADFVRDELTAKKEERDAVWKTLAREADALQEAADRVTWKCPTGETASGDSGTLQNVTGPAVEVKDTTNRSEVNATFPANGTKLRELPARLANDREPVKFLNDRIGAKGLDVRPWIKLLEQEVAHVNGRLLNFRVEHDLDAQEVTNGFEVTRHLIKWAVSHGAEDPEPEGPDGKRKRVGIGKLGAYLHDLYLGEGWRDEIRRELRTYLKGKAREAMQIAENQAFGDAPDPGHQTPEGLEEALAPPAEDDMIAAGAGDTPEGWSEGRE